MRRFLRPALFPSYIAALIVVFAVLTSWCTVKTFGLALSDDEYDVAGWELRHFPTKWLYKAGHLFDDGLSQEEENATLLRYVELQRQIETLEGDLNRANAAGATDDALLQELRSARGDRDRLENTVESIVEGRLTAVAADLGLERSPPLFPDARWLFPPFDFEFDEPPYVLVTSPRDHIELEGSTLLRGDLQLEDALRLEEKAQSRSDNVSALVVPTGGIATYPAVISPGDNYLDILDVAAHEWIHEFLSFEPLGSRYFNSEALRTINETVASIGGEEMARLTAERFPLPALPPLETTTPKVDVFAELRSLRLEVDRLLGEGKVDEAEALMEEKRQYLADNGYFIRKINQAYFAFHGLYGTSGASSSPIGPKVETLRQQSPSLGDFIRAASGIGSEGDLDRLLSSTE